MNEYTDTFLDENALIDMDRDDRANRISDLLDMLDTHSCILDVEGQSCICVEIGEELGNLGYQFPETKYVQLDEIPF